MKQEVELDGFIEKLISHLSKQNKFHISIHYLNGSFLDYKFMEISPEHCFHNCEFCNFIKTSPKSLKRCMKNKGLAINKVTQTGVPLVGSCHMGLTEIMYPVLIGGKVVCIISLGHILLESSRDKVRERVIHTCKKNQLNTDDALKKIDSLQLITDEDIDYYKETAQLIASSILLCSEQIPKNSVQHDNHLDMNKNVHWIIRQTINYINQYYYSSLKLTDLSSHFFLNPQYLCRLFAKETGVPCSEYINSVRLQKAKELLSETGQAISDIAFAVGFNSVTYFNFVFKKHIGLTPVQYRQKNNRE